MTLPREGFELRPVVIFVLVTYALTWALEWVALGPLGEAWTPTAPMFTTLRTGVVLGVAMWFPALASWIVCRFVTGEPWAARVGIALPGRPRTWPWARLIRTCLGAVGLVAAATVVSALLAAVTGIADFDIAMSGLSDLLRSTPGSPPAVVVLLATLVGAVVAPFTLNGALALGEELGWRGWLLPALLPLGRPAAVGIVGVIWGLWHAPLIALIGYEYGPVVPPAAGIPMFTLFCVAAGAVLAWLRLRGLGIWPCAVGHGAVNAWASIPTLFYAAGAGPHPLLGPQVGACAAAGYALVAIAVWRLRRGRTVERGARPGA